MVGKMRLRQLLVFIIILAPLNVMAITMTFQWEANTETDLVGYRLYRTSIPGQYVYGANEAIATIPAGTETVTIYNIPDTTFFWVVTAFNNTYESRPSNEVGDWKCKFLGIRPTKVMGQSTQLHDMTRTGIRKIMGQ